MNLKRPVRKPWANEFKEEKSKRPLPLVYKKDGSLQKYIAHFNGFSVIVDNTEHMQRLNEMGNFGKGNLSRNFPIFNKSNTVQIIRQRQLKARKKYEGSKPDKVLVVPDSDSEEEEYFNNLRVKYEIDRSNLKETLNLSLEEAYFLLNELDCLIIYDNNSQVITKTEAWKLFKEVDHNFISNYSVYYYCRSKNWVVKPGIRFGGDFILYKEGPQLYHASYVVIIDVIDENLVRKTNYSSLMNMRNIQGLNRLCETAGKELLIMQVILPQDLEIESSLDLTKITIKETLVKRWRPNLNLATSSKQSQ